uniref:Uncharacterized protein n=1 Tax=Caenorhabditis japonica TaxID=281687 RepID=A0A8R1EFR5_CAEJA
MTVSTTKLATKSENASSYFPPPRLSLSSFDVVGGRRRRNPDLPAQRVSAGGNPAALVYLQCQSLRFPAFCRPSYSLFHPVLIFYNVSSQS